ncbi:hypothetical protein H8E52_08400 [bacterium]|nr:hypothetical protein [bacterium]
MRRILSAGTILSIVALFTLGGTALAGPGCGSKGADAKCSTSKSACSSKAGNAEAKLGCDSKIKTTNSDYFLNSYMNIKSGMHKGCDATIGNAVSDYKTGVMQMIESGEAAEHEEHLKNLVQVLDAWPSQTDGQTARFQKLSNWTIGYMEAFPDRCEGVEVKSCSQSGHSWVETEELTGNPYSG